MTDRDFKEALIKLLPSNELSDMGGKFEEIVLSGFIGGKFKELNIEPFGDFETIHKQLYELERSGKIDKREITEYLTYVLCLTDFKGILIRQIKNKDMTINTDK